MPVDKSLFYYGSAFHRMFDPPLSEGWRVAANLIADGSSVLDIACGTGAFCSVLVEKRHCRVVGVDLSLKMLEFARKMNSSPDAAFYHADATDLSTFADISFDYSTILNLLHEVTSEQRAAILKESLRLAPKSIIADWTSPLPPNFMGFATSTVEATFGHDHNRNFREFQASGGLNGMLKELSLPIKVEYRCTFNRNCREALLVSRDS